MGEILGSRGGVIRLEYNVKSYAMNIGHGGHLVSRILRDFSELSSTLSQEMKRMKSKKCKCKLLNYTFSSPQGLKVKL